MLNYCSASIAVKELQAFKRSLLGLTKDEYGKFSNERMYYLFSNSRFIVQVKEKHKTVFLQQQKIYTIWLLDDFFSLNVIFNL